jgi:DNA-binding transcriptional regulator/RsmH inhibitor MraZ
MYSIRSADRELNKTSLIFVAQILASLHFFGVLLPIPLSHLIPRRRGVDRPGASDGMGVGMRQASRAAFVPALSTNWTPKAASAFQHHNRSGATESQWRLPSHPSTRLRSKLWRSLLSQFQQRLGQYDPFFSAEYDAEAQAILGRTQFLNFDDEGRVRLPDEFVAHAGISERIAFIGLGVKFQIWDPVRFESVERDRIAQALARRQHNGGAA